jgi:hypothetical protein
MTGVLPQVDAAKRRPRSMRRPVHLSVVALLAVPFCFINNACHESPDTSSESGGLQQPLTSFRQVLTSSTTSLTLHPAQEVKIPVRIQNPGTETWVSAGHYPVTISYKWFNGGQMLPIEGERTVLPGPVAPNQAVNADVRVVAPGQPGNFDLRITLVQEAISWFMMKSNTFLRLPVTVK